MLTNSISRYLLFGVWSVLLLSLTSSAYMLDAKRYKALFKLQPYRSAIVANYEDAYIKQATLLNLNQNINRWYLLEMVDHRGRSTIVNLMSTSSEYNLALGDNSATLLIDTNGTGTTHCSMTEEIIPSWRQRHRNRSAYKSICNDKILMVFHRDGYQRGVEKGAEIVRWLGGDFGEDIVNGVKRIFFEDRYRIKDDNKTTGEVGKTDRTPLPGADVAPRYKEKSLSAYTLGLKRAGSQKRLLAGRWYRLKNFPECYASIIMPGMVSKVILNSYRDRVNRLDGIERNSMAYLMALSLDRYTLGWGHGTDHPGVGWSSRARNIKKDNPWGPDGFNSMSPLVPLGHVPPYEWSRTIGTFSAGFQKRHGAFRYGPLSTYAKAHHYGFMQDGVMLVTPSTELATVIIYKDGKVEMKCWTEEDYNRTSQMRFIRQNGVPLIHPNTPESKAACGEDAGTPTDENLTVGIPGKWVKHWGAGNWSGSVDKQLRTPRGAACIMPVGGVDYLVYAYFSSATPSAMARVLQAYGCRFAMHLDMNSPGQAYGALVRPGKDNNQMSTELLVTDMDEYMGGGSQSAPRYFMKPDYKDFFYILKKREGDQ
jgi:hypothetical protein